MSHLRALLLFLYGFLSSFQIEQRLLPYHLFEIPSLYGSLLPMYVESHAYPYDTSVLLVYL
jgi:hypothetical protein